MKKHIYFRVHPRTVNMLENSGLSAFNAKSFTQIPTHKNKKTKASGRTVKSGNALFKCSVKMFTIQ